MNVVPEVTPDPLLLNVAELDVLPAVVAELADVALATVPETFPPATELAVAANDT